MGARHADTFIFLGNGDGTFQSAGSLKISQGNVDGTKLADFNKDEKLDLALDSPLDGTYVLTGNGDGTFGPAMMVGTGGSGLQVLDVNGDGKLDIAVVDTKGNLEIYAGNGDATFGAGKLFSTGSLSLLGGADFNGDGAIDLFSDTLGNGVAVLLNAR